MDAPIPKLDPMTDAALKSLKDIIEPPPVSWFPGTWGWGVVAVVLVLIGIVWVVLSIRRYRANRYRREALAKLDEIEGMMRDPARRPQALHELAELLKRVALVAWPRKDVAALSGAAWVAFLDGNDGIDVRDTLNDLVGDFEYHGEPDMETLPSNVSLDAITAARQWIGGHHVPA